MNLEDYQGTYLTLAKVGHVAVITLSNPPHNYFNRSLLKELDELLKAIDGDSDYRVNVLAAEGKVFCAGGDFNAYEEKHELPMDIATEVYAVGMQLFKTKKPIVAAVQGAAVGGGLGLALVADFRVTCHAAKFSANFTRLGIHPGFGLSVTLPRLIGQSNAELMFYTARRFSGTDAFKLGLANVLVEKEQVKPTAIELAQEISENSPIAIMHTKQTMRQGVYEKILTANQRELELQQQEMLTEDFREGLVAYAEKRVPIFNGN